MVVVENELRKQFLLHEISISKHHELHEDGLSARRRF